MRGWISEVAQRAKLGRPLDDALRRAFDRLTQANPFPATLGRICPHPCEEGCSRASFDGAVAVHDLERFIGDWALAERLPLAAPACPPQPESIGVIGAGPAGLSFAWQLLRRGYEVTVYEKESRAGGMFDHGIPEYRLPGEILESELQRLFDAGVGFRANCGIAEGRSLEAVLAAHEAVFVGIGAGEGAKLEIEGEDGPGVMTGAEWLARSSRGEPVPTGTPVIVVGGGNTAMDAARSARRFGALVTVLYRRTRDEMPAISSEVAAAAGEGVGFQFLCAPVRVLRNAAGAVERLVVQHMRPGEPDASGRRSVSPIAGAFEELPCRTLVAAVSQSSDWRGLQALRDALKATEDGAPRHIWCGGDAVRPGIAAQALAQGRSAAEAVHAQLRGLAPPPLPDRVAAISVKSQLYEHRQRALPVERSAADRLSQARLEQYATLGTDEFLQEAARCFSCGACFGCENCHVFCNAGGFHRLASPRPGFYFSFDPSACEGCRKCIDLCPCGHLVDGGQPPARIHSR